MTQPPQTPTDPLIPQYQAPPTVASRKWLIILLVVGSFLTIFCCGCGLFGLLFTARSPAPIVVPAAPRLSPPPPPTTTLPGGASLSPASLPDNFPATFPVHPDLTPITTIPDSRDNRGGLVTLEATTAITHNTLAQWFDREALNAGWKETASTFHPDQVNREYTKDGLIMRVAISAGAANTPARVHLIYSSR